MGADAPGTDFIVSEILSELKTTNERKERHIQRLVRSLTITILAALLAIVMIVLGCLWFFSNHESSLVHASNTGRVITVEEVVGTA